MKRAIYFLLALLVAPLAFGNRVANKTAGAATSFNADLTSNLNPMSSPNYLGGPGGFGDTKIASNQIVPAAPATDSAFLVATGVYTATANQSCTWKYVTDGFGGILRSDSNGNCYMMQALSSTALRMYAVTGNGSSFSTQIGNVSALTAFTSGTTLLKMVIIGTTINVYRDDTGTGSSFTLIAGISGITDSTYSTGQPGAYCFGSGATTLWSCKNE